MKIWIGMPINKLLLQLWDNLLRKCHYFPNLGPQESVAGTGLTAALACWCTGSISDLENTLQLKACLFCWVFSFLHCNKKGGELPCSLKARSLSSWHCSWLWRSSVFGVWGLHYAPQRLGQTGSWIFMGRGLWGAIILNPLWSWRKNLLWAKLCLCFQTHKRKSQLWICQNFKTV